MRPAKVAVEITMSGAAVKMNVTADGGRASTHLAEVVLAAAGLGALAPFAAALAAATYGGKILEEAGRDD